VVTSVAAEGMGLTHGVDALIADDPGEFARSVVDLHRDRELWERLSSGGRRKIEERFSAGAAREALVELLDRLGLREAGAAAG
jgi:glycosyltransferase involved in cell wall biosynthesis